MKLRPSCIPSVKRGASRGLRRRGAPRRWRARTIASASLCACVLMLVGSACGGEGAAPASQTVVSAATTNAASQDYAIATPISGTPSVRDYAKVIARESATMESSWGRLTNLLQSPKPKDKTWKIALSNELTTWQQIYQEARLWAPPPAYQQFHAKYLQGLEKFSEAARDLQNGLDKIDAGLVNSALSKMQQGVNLVAQANNLLPQK